MHAELLPADKRALDRARMAAGRRVAMIGDGVNDAPPLAAATVGPVQGELEATWPPKQAMSS